MSNAIPPFLSNTPPPIDFDETNDAEDDFGTFEANDSEYGILSGVDSLEKSRKSNENLELPLPQDTSFPLFLNQSSEKKLDDNDKKKCENENVNNGEIVEKDCEIYVNTTNSITGENDHSKESNRIFDNNCVKGNDSGTEIVINQITENLEHYLNVDLSQQKNRDDSPQSIEFGNSHLSEDDCSIGDFQTTDIIKYDDNTSLPSLKFDPVENLKIDTAPVFEESSVIEHQELDDSKSESLEDTLNSCSAFQKEHNKHFFNSNINKNTGTFELQYENENISSSNIKVRSYQDENDVEKSCYEFVNDDDEFDGFETFSCDRNVEINVKNNIQEIPKNSIDVNNTFEADFSQFEFDCNNISMENDIIKNVKLEKYCDKEYDESLKGMNQGKNGSVEEIDDDFGEFNEFNDFKEDELTKTIEEDITSSDNAQDKLKSVIEMMFPKENLKESLDYVNDNCQRGENFDKLQANLNEIDSAKALDYQWLQSNIKHSLIKALGIDSRNILYGEKWISNMPRFAANLGFSPLEPLKPTKITSNQSKENIAENKKKSKSDVPAVEFDWNSSGLVNPLDGMLINV